MRETRDRHGLAFEAVGDVMRGRLTINGGVHGEDHFFDLALGDAFDEHTDVEIIGTNAIKRREHTSQHMIAALVRHSTLQRPEIAHIFHHA